MPVRIRDPYNIGAYYELWVNNEDVSSLVFGDIVLDHQEDRITTLSFTLNNGQYFAEKLTRFMPVSLFAGSMDTNNRRLMFKGVLKKINASFPGDGRPKVNLIGYGGAYRAARQLKTIVYPSSNCERAWAKGKQEIKLSEIVKHIIDESFYGFPVELDIKKDRTFDLKNPYVQKGVTDWVALRELAKLSNCVLYELASQQDAQHKIFFVDQDNARQEATNNQNNNPFSFRYLNRETDGNFIIFKPTDGEIIVDSLDFQMNVDLNGSLRIVTDFNEQGETDKTYVQKYDPETEDIISYELKPTEYFNELEKKDPGVTKRVWDRLTYNWQDVTFEEIEPFFMKIDPNQSKVAGFEQIDIGDQGAGPLGWVGYEITATISGDVNIDPYRYYPVYGIGKFSTKNGKGKYYLRSMQHIWGDHGYKQTLNFLK